jgi:hypothetical protein
VSIYCDINTLRVVEHLRSRRKAWLCLMFLLNFSRALQLPSCLNHSIQTCILAVLDVYIYFAHIILPWIFWSVCANNAASFLRASCLSLSKDGSESASTGCNRSSMCRLARDWLQNQQQYMALKSCLVINIMTVNDIYLNIVTHTSCLFLASTDALYLLSSLAFSSLITQTKTNKKHLCNHNNKYQFTTRKINRKGKQLYILEWK